MLAYVCLSCGQCGPILWLCWPMLASGWFMLSQKIRKMGTAKKHRKNAGYFDGRRPILGLCWPILGLCWPILRAMWAYLGAMLAHLEAMLAHLGAMLAQLGAMLAHLGAMLAHLEAYVGPSWGLSWPMLTHLKPQDPKNGKNGKSTKDRKTRDFLAGGRGRRQGARPLSPTERRETPSAMPRPGGPWPDLRRMARERRGAESSVVSMETLYYKTIC